MTGPTDIGLDPTEIGPDPLDWVTTGPVLGVVVITDTWPSAVLECCMETEVGTRASEDLPVSGLTDIDCVCSDGGPGITVAAVFCNKIV